MSSLIQVATLGGEYDLAQREITPRYLVDGDVRPSRYTDTSTHEKLQDLLCNSVPHTLDIGAIYPLSIPDSRRQQEKERKEFKGFQLRGQFVLDVDAQDFDRSGVCNCSNKSICAKCWTTLIDPVRLALIHTLRTRLGLQHLYSSFSGRRGFHIWVLDRHTVSWTVSQRSAMVKLISKECAFQSGLHVKLDENVSKDPHHLVKAPLAPHWSNGLISSPLSLDKSMQPECFRFDMIPKEKFIEWDTTLKNIIKNAYL